MDNLNSDAMLINNIRKSRNKGKTKIKNLNVIINQTIDELRKHGGSAELKILINKIPELSDERIIQNVSKSEKIQYIYDKNILQLKSKHNIHTIDELKNLIRNTQYGLIENCELYDAYPGIKQDLEILKKEKFVKVIKNEENKYDVLFYKDPSDPIEKIISDPCFEESIQEIRKIWNLINEEQTSFKNFDPTLPIKRDRDNDDNSYSMKPVKKKKTK